MGPYRGRTRAQDRRPLGPFFARPFIRGRQRWTKWQAAAFKTAKAEAEPIVAGHTPVRTAVGRFLDDAAKTKKARTVQNCSLHLKHFIEEAYTDTVIRFRNWMQAKSYLPGPLAGIKPSLYGKATWKSEYGRSPMESPF